MSKDQQRYSEKELKEFEIIIDEKLAKARQQYAFSEGQLKDLAQNSDSRLKSLDDGASTTELDTLARLSSRQQVLIDHLEQAKVRIRNKTYGVCRVTGKLIDKQRLLAVPHATLSIDAKQKLG